VNSIYFLFYFIIFYFLNLELETSIILYMTVCDSHISWFGVIYRSHITMLWQLLDQCPIAVLQVNFLDRYLVGNTSCIIHKRTRQGITTVFYRLFIISIHSLCYDYASTVCPTLMSMLCPYVLLLIYHMSTLRPACHLHVPWCHTLNPTLHLHYPCIHHIYTIRKPYF